MIVWILVIEVSGILSLKQKQKLIDFSAGDIEFSDLTLCSVKEDSVSFPVVSFYFLTAGNGRILLNENCKSKSNVYDKEM